VPTWLKVLLIIAIVIVLLVVGVIGFGAVWWMRNKDELMSRAEKVVTEAKDFGANSDNQGCVDEAVARYKREPGFTNAISTAIFMRPCLDASRATPGFCEHVPKPTEFTKSAQWRTEQCRRVDLSRDSYCQQLFQPVQQFCDDRK